MTITTGTLVVVDFPGVTGIKRRPAIIISSNAYHAMRPDVVLAVITSQVDSANAPTDYVLQDWAAAGLNKSSAFRAFFVTLPAAKVVSTIGQSSARDWHEIQTRLRLALAIS